MEIFKLIDSNNLEGITAWVNDKNKNKNVVNIHGTPLHYAITKRNEDAAKIFIKNDLYIQSVDEDKNTPLHLAAICGLANLPLLLIKRGAVVNTQNKFGNSPLHCASLNGQQHAVVVLMEKGAQINVFNEDGNTPLRYATYCSMLFEKTKPIKILLNEGASLLNNGNYYDYLKLTRNENIILLLKHHVKLQKFVLCRKKLLITSGVFLKFSSTFKL